VLEELKCRKRTIEKVLGIAPNSTATACCMRSCLAVGIEILKRKFVVSEATYSDGASIGAL